MSPGGPGNYALVARPQPVEAGAPNLLFLSIVRDAPMPGATWPYLQRIARERRLAMPMLQRAYEQARKDGHIQSRDSYHEGKLREVITLTNRGWSEVRGNGDRFKSFGTPPPGN